VGEPHHPERRREPRYPLSFPVWWRQSGDTTIRHGWMLNLSAHGAALLASRHDRPALGDSVSISLVGPQASLDPKVSRVLLDRATVCRVDPVAPSLERVALHFESSLWQEGDRCDWKRMVRLFQEPVNGAIPS